MNEVIHISLAKTDFKCPFCQHQHNDENDKYYAKMEKNKSGYTKLNCSNCGKRFGLASDMTGQYVGFELLNIKDAPAHGISAPLVDGWTKCACGNIKPIEEALCIVCYAKSIASS